MKQETFGQYITRLRVALGFSKAELARQTGMTRDYIGKIEDDHQPSSGEPPNVGEDNLRALARVLGVPESEMFRRGYRPPQGYALAPIEYETDPDLQMVVEAYRGASDNGRRHIKGAAELALEVSREGAVGRHAE